MENNAIIKPTVSIGDYVIGTVISFAGKVNPGELEQTGWLYCDGSAISRTRYNDLFNVIGTLHGAGDGTNTFNLPDYRGLFLRGVDDRTGHDPDASTRKPAKTGGAPGDSCGSIQTYATAKPVKAFTLSSDGIHRHSIANIPADSSSSGVAGGAQSIWNSGNASTDAAGKHVHTIEGGDAESRPINAYVNFIIKYAI